MAHTTISNRKNVGAALQFSSNSAVTLIGNSSFSSIARDNEYVSGAFVSQLSWGTDGIWKIWRGQKLIAALDSTGYLDLAGNGMALIQNPQDILTVENTGSSGSLVISLKKTQTDYDALPITTTYGDRVNYAKGQYLAYCSPWSTFFPNQSSWTSGNQFSDSVIVTPSAFPNLSTYTTRWPESFPTDSGVYGYMSMSYGNYDAGNGSIIQTPVTPVRIGELSSFTEIADWAISGTGSVGVLSEFYPCSVANDAATKIAEVGVHQHASETLAAFVAGCISLGQYTDEQSRVWDVYTTNGAVPYIQFAPVGLVDVKGRFDHMNMLRWLISQGQLSGQEWINGRAIGVEPVRGSNVFNLKTFSVVLTGGSTISLPSTISTLASSGTTSSTATMTFTNSTNALGYVYRVNSGRPGPLPLNKIITGLGSGTTYSIQVAPYNNTGRGAWSNAVNVTTAASAVVLPAGAIYQNADMSGFGTQEATKTSNAVTSPALTTTGATVQETTAEAEHWLARTTTASLPIGTYTQSVYVKQNAGVRHVAMVMYSSNYGSAKGYNFDLSALTVQGTFGYGALYTNASASIVDAGAGWKKITMTYTSTASDTAANSRLTTLRNDYLATYLGVAGQSLAYWGYDFRAG